MPTYKFDPNLEGPGPYNAVFEVYDPETRKINLQNILHGQTFITKKYLSENMMKKEQLIFISDEPYISPIFCNFTGIGKNDLIVPDIGQLFDIYVSIEKDPVLLYFNNDKDRSINIFKNGAGIVFKSVSAANVRVITTDSKSKYSIALLLSNQFAHNNG